MLLQGLYTISLHCPQWSEFYIPMNLEGVDQEKSVNQAWLKFAAACMDKLKAFWRIVLWPDETNIELLGHNGGWGFQSQEQCTSC